MKKFLKKRSPEPATLACDVPVTGPRSYANVLPHMEDRHPSISLDHFEDMRRERDFLAAENSKLKSAMQNLTDKHITIQDELASLRQKSPDLHVQSDAVPNQPENNAKMDEIQKLVRLITEENDHLSNQLALEKGHVLEAQKLYEAQLHRLSTEYERCRMDNARLQQDLQTAILENDNWRVRVSALAFEKREKSITDDLSTRSKFEACKIMLDELRTRYKAELARVQDALEKSLEEKRNLGLRLSRVESELATAAKSQETLWENAKLMESENQKFSALLESKDERIQKMESMFKELLTVSKEMVNTKAKGEKEWMDNRQELTMCLQKLEKKCHTLKEDNEKLKTFKQEAMSKLVEARKLLLLDNLDAR